MVGNDQQVVGHLVGVGGAAGRGTLAGEPSGGGIVRAEGFVVDVLTVKVAVAGGLLAADFWKLTINKSEHWNSQIPAAREECPIESERPIASTRKLSIARRASSGRADVV